MGGLSTPVFLQWIVKVEKERASEKFTTLERFSWEASGPLFFTMDREGQNEEGFIMVGYPRIS